MERLVCVIKVKYIIQTTLDQAFINLLSIITTHKQSYEITLIIHNETFNIVNCLAIVSQRLPIRYWEKRSLKGLINGFKTNIQYKLLNKKKCQNKICSTTLFILVKNMSGQQILGDLF